MTPTQIAILVVEDDPIMTDMLTQKLALNQFIVQKVVASGEAAVDEIRNNRAAYDIVLMDIVLEGDMNGITAARQIEEIVDIPIIFLSGVNDGELLDQVRETRPYSIIFKPFRERELVSNIAIALDKFTLEQTLKEKNKLLKELHHRIKNNMQSLASLMSLHSAQITDEGARHTFQQCISQIDSISIVHEILYRTNNLNHIPLDMYIQRLTDRLISNQPISSAILDVEYELESITLSIEQAIPLGLVINEILSTAMYTAFSSYESGHLMMRLKRIEPYALTLIIQHDGECLPAPFETMLESHLGAKLVDALVRNQLQGNLTVDSKVSGVSYRIDLPKK